VLVLDTPPAFVAYDLTIAGSTVLPHALAKRVGSRRLALGPDRYRSPRHMMPLPFN